MPKGLIKDVNGNKNENAKGIYRCLNNFREG